MIVVRWYCLIFLKIFNVIIFLLLFMLEMYIFKKLIWLIGFFVIDEDVGLRIIFVRLVNWDSGIWGVRL